MVEKEVNLIAYWNGDSEYWRLSKCPETDNDLLVSLTIEVLESNRKVNYNVKSFKKISRELRGLSEACKKWSK